MPHLRCCDDPDNLFEHRRPTLALMCRVCGAVLAIADDRGELFADY